MLTSGEAQTSFNFYFDTPSFVLVGSACAMIGSACAIIFYSLNVTQEGTDVNGFWANGQPINIM